MPTPTSKRTSYLHVASVVLAYFVVSISLVFANKELLSDAGSTIPAPIFVTWFQCVLTALIIYALGLLGHSSGELSALKEFPKQTYRSDVAARVLKLSLVFVGMVTFNNLCLKYVEVSFYNVARALTIVYNVVFTYFFFGTRTSFRTLLCLLVVIIGFFVGADGEVNFSVKGTLFGVSASCFVSLNSIYTKSTMNAEGIGQDKWRLAFYSNVNASFLFLPLIFLMGEHHIIWEHRHLLASPHFWVLMTVSGVLGFLIGIVTVMQITVTSPLTHNMSGTAKACVQAMLGVYIYGNETTPKANFGAFLVIFGSAAYAYVRMLEDQAKFQKPKPKAPAGAPKEPSLSPTQPSVVAKQD